MTMLRLGLLCLAFLVSSSAWAAQETVLEKMNPEDAKALQKSEQYIQADWLNLLRALIRYNALDINDDILLDDYAQVAECDLYIRYYSDDFEWNRIRRLIRESIAMHRNEYPTRFHLDTKLQLSRYNFEKKLYQFTPGTEIEHVNSFQLLQVTGKPCVEGGVKNLPMTFRAVLNDPLSIPGLSLEPKDAETLLHIMDDIKNTDHLVYTRFNFQVVYMQNLHRSLERGSSKSAFYAQGEKNSSDFRIDMKLDSIQYFADEGMTAQIYAFKPK